MKPPLHPEVSLLPEQLSSRKHQANTLSPLMGPPPSFRVTETGPYLKSFTRAMGPLPLCAYGPTVNEAGDEFFAIDETDE